VQRKRRGPVIGIFVEKKTTMAIAAGRPSSSTKEAEEFSSEVGRAVVVVRHHASLFFIHVEG